MPCPEIQFLKTLLGTGEEDLSVTKAELDKNIISLKENLQNVIQDKRINLTSLGRDNGSLSTKLEILKKRLMEVSVSNDDMSKAANLYRAELACLSASLENLYLTVSILNKLVGFQNSIQQIPLLISQKHFFECSEVLITILTDMKESEEIHDLQMFRYLQQESILLREQILFEISELWATSFNFKVDKGSKNCDVSLKVDRKELENIHCIIKTSFLMNEFFIEKKLFAKLKESIIIPIIFHPCKVVEVHEEDAITLNVTINESKNNPHYLHVFEGIVGVLKFIKTHLNVELCDGSDLMSLMGKVLAQEVTSALMKHCLSEVIPSQPGELKVYTEIVANAEKLQTTLQEMGFLPNDYSPFKDSAHDMNLLFANKIYQSYLERARDIVKKDLHTITTSEEVVIPDVKMFPAPLMKTLVEKLNLSDEKQIFVTKCKISKSAQDIMDLVATIVKEMEFSEETRSIHLLYTARNIFEIYSAVVPLHHKKMLETIPQQVAIFHNNCLHFAFHLIFLAYKCRQQSQLRDHCHILLDQAVALRQLGVRSLEKSVSDQRSQITFNLIRSGLGTFGKTSKLDSECEKTIRQCIRQLQLLRNVWYEILPDNVYSNAIGFIVDAFTEEIVSFILPAEDISSQTASELVDMLKIVQERIPTLFIDPREVHRLCRKWARFNELVFVLGANLGGINGRWADGAGPLACEFTADHIKHLLRALFRNTEQRAALIARIK